MRTFGERRVALTMRERERGIQGKRERRSKEKLSG